MEASGLSCGEELTSVLDNSGGSWHLMHRLGRICNRKDCWLALLFWPFCAVAQPDLEGVWMLDGSFGGSGFTFTEAHYTEEGQRRHDAFDILTDDPSLECVPSGISRIWDNPGSPIEFQQFDDRVSIIYEMFDLRRTVELDQRGHPLEPEPSTVNIHGQAMPTMGHSIGWYENDVFVVETLAFAPGLVTTLRRYVPQSAALRSVERFYRDGDWLALEITYVDPIILTEPVHVEYRFRRSDYAVVEYGCTPENAGYDGD
jgi:hypothetical protein